MLTCLHCGVLKPFDDFWPTKQSIIGYRQPCKSCLVLRTRMGRELYKFYLSGKYPLPMQKTIRCIRCNTFKHESRFAKDSKSCTLHQPYCKQCCVEYKAEYTSQHKEKIRLSGVKYRAENKGREKQRHKIYDIVYAPRKAEKKKQRRKQHPEKYHQEGVAYYAKNKDKMNAVSATWWKAHPDKRKNKHERHRARKKSAPMIEKIDRQTVFERDKWTCQICHKRVPRKTKNIKLRATLDHIVPLSKGGSHTYANVVLAHHICNSSKGNRAIPQQMRLY